MRLQFRARVAFDRKSRAVMSGFRPTLVFEGKKVLSSLDAVAPEPLQPSVSGDAIVRIAWEWPEASPVKPDITFLILEGEREVGHGKVIEML